MTQTKAIKLPRTYKLLLALAVVIGPFSWLMFTQDGQRRSDLFVLTLLGRPSFDVAYQRLNPAVSATQLRDQFPKVDFDCQDHPPRQVCRATIGSFNVFPAYAAQLEWQGQRLQLVQLIYRQRYRDAIEVQLRQDLGPADEYSTASNPVLLWVLDHGLLLLPAEKVSQRHDAALIWRAPPLPNAQSTDD